MRANVWIIFVFLFIILISSVYAICPQPDISTYNTCTNGCPDAVKYTEKYAQCVNNCISSWTKIQDAYRTCQKTEEEQKKLEEQQKLELQNKTRVSTFRGNVSILHADGTRESISKVTALQKGDKVETGPGGHAIIEMPENGHTIELGEKSSFVYNYKNGPIVDLLFGRLRYKFLKRMLRPGEIIVGGGIRAHIVLPGKGGGAPRGTDFIAENYGDIGRFYVQEGIVDVTNIKNESFEVNAWQMITVYANGTTVKSELSATNWYGLLNSIEVGVDFTPIFETTNPGEQKTTNSGEQKTSLPVLPIVIVIVIGLLIIFGAFKIKKQKKK